MPAQPYLCSLAALCQPRCFQLLLLLAQRIDAALGGIQCQGQLLLAPLGRHHLSMVVIQQLRLVGAWPSPGRRGAAWQQNIVKPQSMDVRL